MNGWMHLDVIGSQTWSSRIVDICNLGKGVDTLAVGRSRDEDEGVSQSANNATVSSPAIPQV
jgi:hypothetical protein